MSDLSNPPRIERYLPADHTKVDFAGGFWESWSETVRKVTVPSQHRRLDEEGFLEVLNFRDPPAPLVRPIQPSGLSMQHFFDSDFGKWIEAASYTLRNHPNPQLESKIDDIVDRLAAGQLPDGYLNSWFIRREPDKRWTNLRDLHEMYSMGHLLEGAVAYFEATGKRRFLDVMLKLVDHIIDTFGPEPDKQQGYDAHEEIEIALIKLYRVTKDPRHLELAKFFIDARGQMPSYYDDEARRRGDDPKNYIFKDYSYSQAHMPVREQTEVTGHAVRAMYLFSAMADVAVETGDMSLLAACDRLFDNLTTRQLYVTGGLGPAHSNEGFTREYDLPNDTAYAETCAAVGLAFWGHRMAQIDLDARFTDHVELVLFNGALSGISRDGEHYFYDNVLESHGEHRRWKWHYCPCCPTNIARLLASLGSYFYTTRGTDLAIHLYGSNTAALTVDVENVTVTQATHYPWDGDVRITVSPDVPRRMAIKLRVPGWCRKATFEVNGEPVRPVVSKGYATIEREWRAGDKIRLHMDMPVERLSAHPAVTQNAGRVALKRGPIVYCLEEVDNGIAPQRFVLKDNPIQSEFVPGLLGGAVVLAGEAEVTSADDWSGTLYRSSPPSREPRRFRAIPYHLWANREPGGMQVWIRADGA
ncbi:MAG: glycoside hydrolase family 127 protein [Devosia sp.]